MKVKKNHFRIGEKRHYFITFSEDKNIMLKEIKTILNIFTKNNVKIYFTGFFRTNIPNTFKKFDLHTNAQFYLLEEINQVNYLIDENFINSIVNLSFYIFCNDIDTSKFNIKDAIVNLYFENCFTECGLIFNKNIYNEVETINNLKLI